MSVYETLFDWQRQFVDKNPKEYLIDLVGPEKVHALESDAPVGLSGMERIGFFLRMGIGKTKISISKAEKLNGGADCIFAVSLKTKVVAGEMEGEFGDELKRAGYKVFYAHKALDENGELTIPSLDSKKNMKLFEQAIADGEKLAYIMNHEHMATKKGYQRLVYLATKYKNIAWIIDEAHKISNRKSGLSKRVYDMLYKWGTPEVKISIREVQKERKEAIARQDWKRVKDLDDLTVLAKENVFKKSIKGFYLLTGTPNASGYVSFYWLLVLLGHIWKHEYQFIDDDTGEVTTKALKEYDAFFEEFCVEDTYAKKWNPFGKAIKKYKNVDKLLDIVQLYGFFAKTENYFKGMPTRSVEVRWVGRDMSYVKMTDPDKHNPHYRVLDGYICDSPALLGLRARQLASGFMGNAEKAEYYHTMKIESIEELLRENPDNYLIFYNWTPELYMIMEAADSAGYNIDVWYGKQKSQSNYRKATGEEGEKNVLIANIDSGSAALNLQKYSKVIFFAPPELFMDFDQAIGRIERIGQKAKEVEVIVMIAKGTVEEKIWKKLQKGENYTEIMYSRDFIWREI